MSVSASLQNDRRRRLEVRFETILIAIVMVFLAVVFAPTTLVVAFAMAPTVLTFVLDDDPSKNRTLSVGALNLAGTVPALFELWARWNTIPGAVEMIATAHPWRLAFGGAFAGWLLTVIVPVLSANYVVRQRENDLDKLEQRHQQMRDVWGLQVDPGWRAADPAMPAEALMVEVTAKSAPIPVIAATASAEPSPESL
jgi:TctA family transporter